MAKFLRENAAIVIGAALPVVVALFFVLATQLPKAYVAPPAHDLLLLSQNNPGAALRIRVDVRVENERLRARAYRPDYAGDTGGFVPSGIVPRLYLWEHETQSVRELTLELPEGGSFANGTEVVVPELVGRRVITATIAPDGYSYATTGYDGGVFGLFFNRDGPRTVLEKEGAVQRIRLPGDAPYWGTQFLGWVVE